MIIWPEALIDDIARRICVLYLGSGVSANSVNSSGKHPPTWIEFLNEALELISVKRAQDYVKKLLREKNMLMACDVIINQIGDHKFIELAKDRFLRTGYSRAKIHEHIYNLDARIVITPNVDKIYDHHANSQSEGTVVVKKHNEVDVSTFLRAKDRVIFKAHGTIESPSEMVFSRHQYTEARYKYSTFYKLLDSLALTHTYLFIGCGLNDPDIQLTLENNNFWFPGCRPHYFVTAKESMNPDLKNSLKKNCNLEVLTYSNPEKNHSHLSDSLEKLVQSVESRRSTLADTQDW